MADTTKTVEKDPKKSWFKGIKSEFKKIVWPDKDTLARQSVTVVTISVLLGVLIAAIDLIIQLGVKAIL